MTLNHYAFDVVDIHLRVKGINEYRKTFKADQGVDWVRLIKVKLINSARQ
jgi:hypothetical protein